MSRLNSPPPGGRRLALLVPLAALLIAGCLTDYLLEGAVCSDDSLCSEGLFCHDGKRKCVKACANADECGSGLCEITGGDVRHHCELDRVVSDGSGGQTPGTASPSGSQCPAYCAHIGSCLDSICPVPFQQLTGDCFTQCEHLPETWHQIPQIIQMPCEQIQVGWCGEVQPIADSCACGQ